MSKLAKALYAINRFRWYVTRPMTADVSPGTGRRLREYLAGDTPVVGPW